MWRPVVDYLAVNKTGAMATLKNNAIEENVYILI